MYFACTKIRKKIFETSISNLLLNEKAKFTMFEMYHYLNSIYVKQCKPFLLFPKYMYVT